MNKHDDDIRAFRRVLRLTERALNAGLKDDSVCCGITASQCHVLLGAEEGGRIPVADLRDQLLIDKGALSRTIDGLVNIGLLERQEHPADRRQQEIELSSHGKVFAADIHAASDARYRAVLEALPGDVRIRITEDLEALAGALRQTELPERECCSMETIDD